MSNRFSFAAVSRFYNLICMKAITAGGGIAGLVTATAFQKAGYKTCLVEKEPDLCSLTSARNASIGRSYEADPYLSYLLKLSLLKLHQLKHEYGSLISGHGLLLKPHEIDYNETDFLNDHPEAGMLRSEQHTHRFSDGSEFSGRYIRGNGIIDIHLLRQILEKQFRQQGGSIITSTEATAVRKGGHIQKIVLTPAAAGGESDEIKLTEKDVFIQAGGSAARADNESAELPSPPLIPHKRHLYYLEGDGDKNFPVIWHEPREFYIRPEGRGYLATHGDQTPAEPYDYTADETETDRFIESLRANLNWADKLHIVSSWACLRTFTLDSLPVTGFDREVENLFHQSGWGGRGISMAAGMLEYTQNLVENRENPVDNPFAVERFLL